MKNSHVKNITLCAFFAALIAIGTHLRIPTPLLPLTFQTLFVVLAGLLLGKKLGAVSVCVYVAAGLIGLPVFTGSFLNPTFGYIIGFIPGAWLAGFIAEKFPAKFLTWLGGALAGIALIYAFGIPYYYLMSKYYLGNELGAKSLLLYFVLMPMPGDIFKSFLAALITQRIKKQFGNYF
ncbi:MAG: biotin transporter BioY [Synergistaceae bacterium]|nr:biotin transporter BioY [Synergistaceae bacterium]